MKLLLIILNLCKGKLLTNLTRDLHKQQYEQHQNVARVCVIDLGQKHKTLNVLNELELSWNSAEKPILLEFQLIEPKLRSIELGQIALLILHKLKSNFT